MKKITAFVELGEGFKEVYAVQDYICSEQGMVTLFCEDSTMIKTSLNRVVLFIKNVEDK